MPCPAVPCLGNVTGLADAGPRLVWFDLKIDPLLIDSLGRASTKLFWPCLLAYPKG
jgi:hypothetical protein